MEQTDATLSRWRAHAARGEFTDGLVAAVGALLAEHPVPCSSAACVCAGANWGEMSHRYNKLAAGGE